MKVGVIIPNAGPKCSPENMTAVAGMADEMGYHSVWVTDHVVLAENVQSYYPYRSHGRWDYPPETYWLDPLLSLCWAAARLSQPTDRNLDNRRSFAKPNSSRQADLDSRLPERRTVHPRHWGRMDEGRIRFHRGRFRQARKESHGNGPTHA